MSQKDSISAWFYNKTLRFVLELFSTITARPSTGFSSSPPGAVAGFPALPHMPCCPAQSHEPASWLQFKNLYNSEDCWGASTHFHWHKLRRSSPSHVGQCRCGEGLWVPMKALIEFHVEVSCMDGWMDGWMDWLASWTLNGDNVMFTATNFRAKKQDYFYITLWLTLHQHRHI